MRRCACSTKCALPTTSSSSRWRRPELPAVSLGNRLGGFLPILPGKYPRSPCSPACALVCPAGDCTTCELHHLQSAPAIDVSLHTPSPLTPALDPPDAPAPRPDPKPPAAAQAALVSTELIRVSILWHEVWHAALEEASRLYFQASDADAMLAALAPLHAQLTNGAQTSTEQVSSPAGRRAAGGAPLDWV